MRMNKYVAALSFAVVLTGCDKQVPQEITGSISLGSGPMADTKLRLYASEKSCEGEYVESTTDTNGAFRFETESTRGGVGVVTQSIAICAEQSGDWKPLWSIVTGGGAPRIILTCKPTASEDEEFCDITVPSASDA